MLKIKISILTPDLSHNCVGRAYLLAKMLKRRYDVEIIGPLFRDTIWYPLSQSRDIPFKTIKLQGRIKPYLALKELIKEINGNVIYASKPLFTSFGLGVIRKLTKRFPLILDIDDWERGFREESLRKLKLIKRLRYIFVHSIVHFYSFASYWNNVILEKMTFYADDITVSNSFLQQKFGGTIIWHGRDERHFDPSKHSTTKARKQYGLPFNKKIVLFFGTPRPHKGIEDLIKAVALVKNKDVLLVIAGLDETPYSQKVLKFARKLLKDNFIGLGTQPFDKAPMIVAISDIVVIPQRRTLSTIGQMPAKIFDAMAMEKPIIATRVNDMPKVLDGYGWIVDPQSPHQISEAIKYILSHHEEAKRKARIARSRFLRYYSFGALSKKLFKIFKKYE